MHTVLFNKSFPRFLQIASLCLLVLVTHHLQASDGPDHLKEAEVDKHIELVCEDDICECKRKDSFNIDSVIKLNNREIKDTAKLACLYHQLAIRYYINTNYERAIHYNKKALYLREQFDDGWLWKSQLNLAVSYSLALQYNQSIKLCNDVIVQTGHPKSSRDSITLYHLLAENYSYLGEFDNAIQYAKKAIRINATRYALINYAEILLEKRDSIDIKNAIVCLDSIYAADRKNNVSRYLYKYKHNLGNAYNFLNESENAIKEYSNALNYSENKLQRAMLLGNIATVLYTQQDDFSAALNYLKESFSLHKNYYYNRKFHYDYAAVHENFGDCYLEQNLIDSALVNYQKALINLTNNFRDEDIFQNPDSKDRTLYVYFNSNLIRVLYLKANAIYKYYQQNKNPKYLDLANQTYQTFIDFHNKLQQDISTENSRLFQAENIVEYLEKALEVAYAKQSNGDFNAEATFRLMEKNKATVLLQSMNEADALNFTNLPDSLIEQEKYLKYDISRYERQWNEAKLYEDTITIINELEQIVFEKKEKYRQLIKTLEENFPDYYQLKYQQNLTSLNDIQNRLDENLALLEYFVGDSNIYVLSIQKDTIKLYKKQKPTDWQNNISIFLEALQDEYSDKNEQFVSIGYNLYQTLLKNPLEDLDNNITRLQIIPDGELNQIPFEVLLTENEENTDSADYRNLSYLIKKYSISYVYSANLLMDNLDKPKLPDAISYGAYASEHAIDEEEEDLFNVREQIKKIRDYFNGVAFLSEKATKARFIKDTSAYKILHFGMHGYVNDESPLSSHLVFTKTDSLNKLYASDLYNIKLNAELAVLNACKTGVGQLQKGEGVMSLSRAFTYAGCPSLVMSLSNILDISSGKVLKGFFKNLKEDEYKDVALQEAKRNYLNTPTEINLHPSHWAGLVVVGNLESLDMKSESHISLNIIFCSIIFLVLLFFIVRYFRSPEMILQTTS